MADPELEEIKRARLAELQQQGSAQDKDKQRQNVEAFLHQNLEPEAVERLNRIRLVNETRVDSIVERLKFVRPQRKITDEQLKSLLNAIAENERKAQEEQKLVFNRRKGSWDDEDLLSGL